MREIKFRGKDKETGEWVYGGFVKNLNYKCYIIDYEGVYTISGNEIIINSHVYEVDPETVGQYTGLKDKNGKEIYGGDILKISPIKERCPNDFQKEIDPVFVEISFENFHWSCGGGKGKSLYNYTSISWIGIEVIDNKHENPELLKEAKD